MWTGRHSLTGAVRGGHGSEVWGGGGSGAPKAGSGHPSPGSGAAVARPARLERGGGRRLRLGGDSVWPTRERKRWTLGAVVAWPARARRRQALGATVAWAARARTRLDSGRSMRQRRPRSPARPGRPAAAQDAATVVPRCVSSPWARWAVFLGSQASVAAWHRWPSSRDANAVAR
ncbi:hypothetical protein OsI_20638 [Oryza sativa Indica Group]|uniref:Uncharacterized protein n=1 Tax=Oryza sativa subsp. indica TaxID=39946 RepID=B8AZZ9_ORYSI|nr:hypothetical protein OsI_20638 [Oryza sativa Indica Group]